MTFLVAPATVSGAVPFRTTNDSAGSAVGAHTLALEVGGTAVPVSAANPLPIAPLAVTLVNRGGVIAAGGVAQVAAPASAGRKTFLIMNPASATEPLFFSLTGTATSADFVLLPGQAFSWPGGTTFTGAVSVLAATTGHAFQMVEGS